MRKILIAMLLVPLLVPRVALAAPQAAPAGPSAGPQGKISDVDLATALCNSPDSSADQTIGGCGALIKSNVLKGTDLADTYNNRATGYLAKQNYDAAIADEGKAIPLDPSNANALNNRCLAYIGKKLADKALADCSAAIKINPGFAHYYRNRASAYLVKNKRVEALADLRIAIKDDPSDKIAMGMLMSFAAKQSEGGAHIVDAKHPAPAALAARVSGADMGSAKPAAAAPAKAPTKTKAGN
jgi:tetratricopeptide (TPR) repeat protein